MPLKKPTKKGEVQYWTVGYVPPTAKSWNDLRFVIVRFKAKADKSGWLYSVSKPMGEETAYRVLRNRGELRHRGPRSFVGRPAVVDWARYMATGTGNPGRRLTEKL